MESPQDLPIRRGAGWPGARAQLPLPGRSPYPMPMVFEPAPREPMRWEYRVVVVDVREEDPLDEERVAALGAEGWLLASVVTGGVGSTTGKLFYYFVRAA